VLSASGLGCQPPKGLGCGFFDTLLGLGMVCGSTGGSYGGVGGNTY
jgi:hypothetical protein